MNTEEQGVRRVAEQNNWFENFSFGGAQPILDWFMAHGISLLGLIIVIALIVWGIKKIRQRRDQIQKLWVFILFFLTKRQMMIPLVITLSQKDDILDEDLRLKLMEIRQQCRDVSFKKDPDARLEIEEQVSKILFFYFSNLEKKEQIREGSKFSKLVKDLEFIDAKLVQLQKVYNNEVKNWNKWTTMPVLSFFSWLVGANPFRAFK